MTATTLHATTVDLDGQGVLITGASGSGKSSLALQLIALGARLVADDQTALVAKNGQLWASRPASLPPLIEARGVGLMHAPLADRTAIALAVDMNRGETNRLPPSRQVTHLGCPIPLLHKAEGLHFAPAILIYLRHGREAP